MLRAAFALAIPIPKLAYARPFPILAPLIYTRLFHSMC